MAIPPTPCLLGWHVSVRTRIRGSSTFTSSTTGSTPNWAHPCFHTGTFILIVVSSIGWPKNTHSPAGSTPLSPLGLCFALQLDPTECRKEIKKIEPPSPTPTSIESQPLHRRVLPSEPRKGPLISSARYQRSSRGNTSFLGKSLIR
jgi:hypothetical protein